MVHFMRWFSKTAVLLLINVSRPRKISPNPKNTFKKGSNFYLISCLTFTKPFLCYFRIKPHEKEGQIIPTNIFDIPVALLVWSTKKKFVLSICSVNRKYFVLIYHLVTYLLSTKIFS